jgi:hypothetical protein
MQRTCGYNFLKHRGRFSFITCFAGHTIRWLSSNFISFIHVIKMKLTSESDIWKRHAKSCTKSPNLKRIMTNNNYNSSFSLLPGPGFKNKFGSSSMEYLIGASKIRKGRQNYIESVKICSNHFEDGEHTFRCSVPTLLLTKSYVKTQQSLHRRCQTLSSI